MSKIFICVLDFNNRGYVWPACEICGGSGPKFFVNFKLLIVNIFIDSSVVEFEMWNSNCFLFFLYWFFSCETLGFLVFFDHSISILVLDVIHDTELCIIFRGGLILVNSSCMMNISGLLEFLREDRLSFSFWIHFKSHWHLSI